MKKNRYVCTCNGLTLLYTPETNTTRSFNCRFSVAQSWTAARQASLSIANSRSLPKPVSIELVMPSSHLVLCHPLLLLTSIFLSIRVFFSESALHIRWPNRSFSFSIGPSNEYSIILQNKIKLKKKKKANQTRECELPYWEIGSLQM